jgi:hypothetical protein
MTNLQKETCTQDGKNEKLYGVYSSPNVVIMIKSKEIRWTEHVARILEKRNM